MFFSKKKKKPTLRWAGLGYIEKHTLLNGKEQYALYFYGVNGWDEETYFRAYYDTEELAQSAGDNLFQCSDVISKREAL